MGNRRKTSRTECQGKTRITMNFTEQPTDRIRVIRCNQLNNQNKNTYKTSTPQAQVRELTQKDEIKAGWWWSKNRARPQKGFKQIKICGLVFMFREVDCRVSGIAVVKSFCFIVPFISGFRTEQCPQEEQIVDGGSCGNRWCLLYVSWGLVGFVMFQKSNGRQSRTIFR